MTAKANILIVDDEANTLASLSRAFRLAGHEAVVCDNAERALELARTQPFDLILSDVVMPRRDGLALLEDLKKSGIEIDPHREDYDYGRFAWITDPDGNRIELWEPAKAAED